MSDDPMLPHLPAATEDLNVWVKEHSAEYVRDAVRSRLSKTDPVTGQKVLYHYLTDEDVNTLLVYLRMGARSDSLTWEEYFQREKGVLDAGNLRMGLATGQVQRVPQADGGEVLQSMMPVDRIDTENHTYLLRGPLAARIQDDGERITFHLMSFEGTFPIANAEYTIRQKTGDVDVKGSVEKREGATWMAARSIAYWEFEKRYNEGDAEIRDVVAQVLNPMV